MKRMTVYYEENGVVLTGIQKADFIARMIEFSNDDEVTHYMVTGLYPGNAEKLEKESGL